MPRRALKGGEMSENEGQAGERKVSKGREITTREENNEHGKWRVSRKK